MSTPVQEKDFVKAIAAELPNKLLGTALDFIRDNMEPTEVYGAEKIIKNVQNTCCPDEVFTDQELSDWAKENGFTKPEKISYTELT